VCNDPPLAKAWRGKLLLLVSSQPYDPSAWGFLGVVNCTSSDAGYQLSIHTTQYKTAGHRSTVRNYAGAKFSFTWENHSDKRRGGISAPSVF
jgi:hypothetical protein